MIKKKSIEIKKLGSCGCGNLACKMIDWVGCEKEEWVQWVNFVEVFVAGLEQWIEEMDLSILHTSLLLAKVMEEALEQSFGLLEFWGFSSFNWRELVHVGNGEIMENGLPATFSIYTVESTSPKVLREHFITRNNRKPESEEDRKSLRLRSLVHVDVENLACKMIYKDKDEAENLKSQLFEFAETKFNNILGKIEFFKKNQFDSFSRSNVDCHISELKKESGENICDNAKCEFQTKFVKLEKVLTQQTKDFDDVKLELSNRTAKFEAYFEKLEKTKVVLERQLTRKVDDSKAEKD
ncbi:hypothetical protein Tco_0455080 [Tanacetum coccineum]